MRTDQHMTGPAAALAAVAVVTALGPGSHALAQDGFPPRLSNVQPPRFIAHVLDRLEPPPGFIAERWRPWSLADDGTVYGNLSDNVRNRPFVSRVGEGTRWLLPGPPRDRDEIRPVNATVDGYVRLFRFTWPQDAIMTPDQRIYPLNFLHPDLFFPYDMNNGVMFAGQVGIGENSMAVTYDLQRRFVFLGPVDSAALGVNDPGSAVGFVEPVFGSIPMKVWHSDGRMSEFALPRVSTTPIGVDGINRFHEVVGTHIRDDPKSNTPRYGWYWSERTGLILIPLLHSGPNAFDGNVFGISDDGWVLGNQGYFDPVRQLNLTDWYLWRPDVGFFNLADLYDWQGQFRGVANDNGNGRINSVGQIALENRLIADPTRTRCVLLDPK